MSKIYLQLDADCIVIGISRLTGEVAADNLLSIDTYDITLLGKRYVNGQFEDVSQQAEPSQPELSEVDKLKAKVEAQQQQLANQEAKLAAQDTMINELNVMLVDMMFM
ncbi:hypothetical protein H1S01_03380 [Heliobacterium chlorum]|uniref:Uncharacterized protein n=1 Tax=Heliobacterium chlorum TaxID=2698 RepID=A0ABR7SYE4_HELCL|nr:hypothetical protein [Heliobacterium chlorum]MBC9783554.1 hypothetical protein [Heliobacterium chlorum]